MLNTLISLISFEILNGTGGPMYVDFREGSRSRTWDGRPQLSGGVKSWFSFLPRREADRYCVYLLILFTIQIKKFV